MAADGILNFIFLLALPLFSVLGNGVLLIACIAGMVPPALRREFIWLGLGSALRCVSAVLIALPQFMHYLSTTSSAILESQRTIIQFGGGFSSLSLLFFVVGFILLAVRARSLPAAR
jgi:hypothetical protein